jgi:hypothetical protein
MATLSTADTAKTDNPLKLLALNAATTATPRSGLLLMPGFIPARAGKSETPLEIVMTGCGQTGRLLQGQDAVDALLRMPGFIPARAGKSETPLEKLARYRRIDHAHPNPSQAQI